MAARKLEDRLLGYLSDPNFVRFRRRLAERSALGSRELIAWDSKMEYHHHNEIRVHHGRRENGENVEVIIVTSRLIGATDALRLARRDPTGSTLVVTATDEQAAILRRGKKIGEHGYAMVDDHVPLMGEFSRAAMICENWFDLDALVNELFFPVAATAVTEVADVEDGAALVVPLELLEDQAASALCL